MHLHNFVLHAKDAKAPKVGHCNTRGLESAVSFVKREPTPIFMSPATNRLLSRAAVPRKIPSSLPMPKGLPTTASKKEGGVNKRGLTVESLRRYDDLATDVLVDQVSARSARSDTVSHLDNSTNLLHVSQRSTTGLRLARTKTSTLR